LDIASLIYYYSYLLPPSQVVMVDIIIPHYPRHDNKNNHDEAPIVMFQMGKESCVVLLVNATDDLVSE